MFEIIGYIEFCSLIGRSWLVKVFQTITYQLGLYHALVYTLNFLFPTLWGFLHMLRHLRMRKMSHFDPYFLSKFDKIYSFDPRFWSFIAFRVNGQC